MQITVNLNAKEFEALQTLLRENPCRSGCCWDECQEKADGIRGEERRYNYCYEGCAFKKAQWSLEDKFNFDYKKNGKIVIK